MASTTTRMKGRGIGYQGGQSHFRCDHASHGARPRKLGQSP
jgi:hypothetical protein